MKKWLFLLLLLPSFAHADEQPPYSVPDPAVMEDFRRIYLLMTQHQHTGADGSSQPADFTPSSTSTYNLGTSTTPWNTLYANGITLSTNASGNSGGVTASSANITSYLGAGGNARPGETFSLFGGISIPYESGNTDFTFSKSTELAFGCDATPGNRTVTLPNGSDIGRIIIFTKIDSGGNVCLIQVSGGDTINGAATSKQTTTPGDAFIFLKDSASDWLEWKIAR